MHRLKKYLIALLLATPIFSNAQINTDQVTRIGRNALYFEDYVLAIQYFNQVIKTKPFLAEPYFYRGVAKISLEDYRGAEDDASMAIERNPFIADAYQVRGVARQNQRNFKGAIDDYTEGLKLMPEEKVLLLNKAVCEDEIGEFDAAQQTYDELLRLDPRNDRAFLGLAHLNMSRGDTATALQKIDKCLELSRNNANAFVLRAELLMRYKEDYDSALADMDEAIKLEPTFAGYFINRAFMKYKLDDYFGAMADYDYAISLQPTTMEGHFNRGLLLAEVGENNKAITDFTFILDSEPDNFMARYNRAMLYYNTGQYKKAIADFDQVLKKYPKFEAGYMSRGEAKRKMGDFKGGNADYDRALTLFKAKKTKVSDFNPAKIEADAARQRAKQKAMTGEEVAESEDEIINRFNTLLTVAPENPVKPEYANKQRGHIQNSNVEVEPEPAFVLSYYAHDNKLNGNTAYVKEIADINDLRLLPATLTLVAEGQTLTERQIRERFASIDYYDGVLGASSSPRAVDYLARGIDELLVKNPDAAIADANCALALNNDYSLIYFLRANAHYLKWRMARAGALQDATTTTDKQTQSMLHRQEEVGELQAAISDLEKVVKLSPRNCYAIYNKGNICQQMGNYTEAISCYNQVLDIKPDFAEAYYNRGLVYMRLGNKERGVADLSKAGELGILPSYNVLKRMN